MKRTIVTCLVSLVLIGCGQSQPPGPVADLLIINGDVVTVDDERPSAEAVAIAGDRILAVGSNDDMAVYRGEATEVVDVAGQMVIPGFIEGHGHYTSFGGALMILDFRYAESWGEIVSMVADATQETPAGEWIVGRGWHQDKWREQENVLVDGHSNASFVERCDARPPGHAHTHERPRRVRQSTCHDAR